MSKWKVVKLREVVTQATRTEVVEPDRKYRQVGVKLWGEGAYERESIFGSQTRYSQLYRAEAGDIIVNKIWARNGSVAVIPSSLAGSYGSGEFPMFTPVSEKLDSRWVHWLTKTRDFWSQCDEKSQGTSGKNRIRPEKFLDVEIPLPPVEEQRRIVGRIEELAGSLAEARGLREESFLEASNLYNSKVDVLLEEYKDTSILLEDLVGYSNLKNGKSVKQSLEGLTTFCLRLSALRDGRIDCKDSKPIPMTLQEASNYLIKKDDVFIVRGNGSQDLVGRAGVVENYLPNTIFPDLFIRIPLDTKHILPSFFVAYWNSPSMRRKIIDTAKTTSGIWKINQRHIASFTIPLLPLSTQQEIVDNLYSLQSQLNNIKKLQVETATELGSLLPSILDKAFKGEL